MVGRNEEAIREYSNNQLQKDIATDQMSLKEFNDPFTGEPISKAVNELRFANLSCALRHDCLRHL